MERGHAEALAPMVEEAMRESALSYSELERLGVTTGPGTFTGQRVGLSFMRGLRVARKRPLVGIMGAVFAATAGNLVGSLLAYALGASGLLMRLRATRY